VEVVVLMMKRLATLVLFIFTMSISQAALARAMKPGEFLVLCYHAVPVQPASGDNYSISQKRFVEHMEYLRTHGYHPVSFNDIVKAHKGEKALPDKPVLLTFDDGYVSYYDFVVPVLEELGYPSVVAVVGNFIDYSPPKGLPEPLMSWEQIKELSSRRLVEVVSHTHDMHKGIQYNPQGNEAPYASALAYNPHTKSYETENDYRARLESDFMAQKKNFKEKLGVTPKVVVWPYGRFNQLSIETAKKAGIVSAFTLEEGFARIENLDAVNRNLIENTSMEHFIRTLKDPLGSKPTIRAMQVDLDLIYDSDREQMDQNLGRLIDRLVAMDVNTVFLQAFADPQGNGNVKSVYFHNSVLPVRADFFSHAVHQMIIRAMTVYAWMPTMSIELPDNEMNERLKVHERREGEIGPSTSWYRRLTPFSKETAGLFKKLYRDLASHSQIHGILFQDDGYLNDREDFHPSAVEHYKKHFGRDMMAENFDDSVDLAQKWSRYKTEALIDYTKTLMQGVREFRPVTLFARNLYASLMDQPESESLFAQNYELFLSNYDHVVVMAYPQMEEVKKSSKWLKNLVSIAGASPQGLEKTVFKIQTYNWRKEAWIDDGILLQELRDILSSGGKHLAYYPDNVFEDEPALDKIKLEMSTRTYPFIP
jgi:biofilm PGA synthesis lipoprotein PgaB